MKKYYYADSNGQQAGPVSYEELAQLHQRGVINSNTQVFEEGTTDWKPYSAHNFPGAVDLSGGVATPAAKKPSFCCSWPAIIAMGCLGIIGVGGTIAVVSCGTAIVAVSAALTAEAQKTAEAVASNSDVQQELGTDLKASFPSDSKFNTTNGVTTFVATFDVTGSKGKGTIEVDKARTGTGPWTYNKLTLTANGKTYDLKSSASTEP